MLELIEGETLAARVNRGPLPIEDVLQFGLEISDALEAAHRHGITHRDLKPANIMLTSAGTKLLDFGLATRLQDRTLAEVTRSQDCLMDGVAGTLPYMAPELLRGVKNDERSDIWALGVLLLRDGHWSPALHGADRLRAEFCDFARTAGSPAVVCSQYAGADRREVSGEGSAAAISAGRRAARRIGN